ncbi:hypothetical protein Tco_0896776 [Tanacetum coccineum]
MPVVAGNQSNGNAGTKACDDAGKARMETLPGKDYIMLPLWTVNPPFPQSSKSSPDAGFKPLGDDEKKVTKEPGKEGGDPSKEDERDDQEKDAIVNNTNNVNVVSTNEVNAVGRKASIKLLDEQNMSALEDIVYSDDDEDVGTEADMNNLDGFMSANPIPTTRVYKYHPVEQIIRNLNLAPQTRRMTKNLEEHGFFSSVQQRTNHKDFQNCLFACFLSQVKPKKATVKVKTVNGEVQLQALVDGKKIIVTEASVRRDLQLNDEEGILFSLMGIPYSYYFASLSAKTTAWNEFNSTIASGIICLATNLKFNFSKYIFESMVKNLENVSGKFLMYPRFVQVFLEKQLEGMSNHKRIYVTPSHTKKIFRNMRRVGKGFSRRETPLFPTMMVQAQEEMGEGSTNPTDPHHTPTIIQPSTSQPQKKQKPRKPKRKDTEVPQPSGPTNNVADEAVYEEMDDSLERAATTATSLDAEQDRGNINKTQSKATLNEPSSLGTSSGSGPRRQETMGDTIAQTGFENVSKTSNDSLLAGVNTPQSDEDSLKLKELMELCTNLQNRVIDLEKTKTSQAQEITSLKRRVKRLEKKGGSRTHGLKRLYKVGLSRRVESSDEEGLGEEDASKQGRIADIDADAGINLVSTHFDADTDMFGVHDLVGDEVVVESEVAVKAASTIPVSAATTTTTIITSFAGRNNRYPHYTAKITDMLKNRSLM